MNNSRVYSRIERVEKLINEKLSPLFLKVEDKSDLHKGHREATNEGETHLSIVVISSMFYKKSKLERHRILNNVLSAELQSGLHAIEMNLLSPDEQKK
tara:strand:- start:1094 stop:1387 length:294 start_codon:yes stop_codon:yes gene_type:complete